MITDCFQPTINCKNSVQFLTATTSRPSCLLATRFASQHNEGSSSMLFGAGYSSEASCGCGSTSRSALFTLLTLLFLLSTLDFSPLFKTAPSKLANGQLLLATSSQNCRSATCSFWSCPKEIERERESRPKLVPIEDNTNCYILPRSIYILVVVDENSNEVAKIAMRHAIPTSSC